MPVRIRGLRAGLLAVLALSSAAMAQEAPPPAFRMCAGCHARTADQKGAVGPYLGGVFGRKAGTAPGFEYSEALTNAGLTWTEDTLRKFLTDPAALVPGTKKVIAVKSPAALDAVIGYLKTLP
jgi:cytochrome c